MNIELVPGTEYDSIEQLQSELVDGLARLIVQAIREGLEKDIFEQDERHVKAKEF